MIDPKNIVDTNDIRRMAGGISTNTLFRWRHRADLAFPAPIATTGSGLDLYDRVAVARWMHKHVVSGRNGKAHVRYTINH